MTPIKKKLKLSTVQYYKMHLKIVSSIVETGLTPKEIEVLAHFMAQDYNIIKDEMINTLSRKKVMEDLDIKAAGLTNHIISMVNKKVLFQDEITKKYTLNPFLKINNEKQIYTIYLENEDK